MWLWGSWEECLYPLGELPTFSTSILRSEQLLTTLATNLTTICHSGPTLLSLRLSDITLYYSRIRSSISTGVRAKIESQLRVG